MVKNIKRISNEIIFNFYRNTLQNTQKFYNDPSRVPKFEAVAEKWSLFKGRFVWVRLNWDFKIIVAVDIWSLF
jgi:hypothetical protein